MSLAAFNPGMRAELARSVDAEAGWSDSTKAIAFDPASSQYAQAAALAFDPGQPYSVSLWYRNPDADTSATGSTVNYGTLFCDGTGALSTQGRLIISMSYNPANVFGTQISGHEGEGGTSFTRTNFSFATFQPTNALFRNIQANEWNHVVFTSTSTSSAAGTIKLYWNGIEVDSKTGKAYAGTNYATKPIIGAAVLFGGTTNYFTGAIDQVATYQRALSAADVATLLGPDNYDRKPQTPYLSSGDPIHLWAMGEYVSGSTMPDQIGSVDMTLHNSPTVSTSVAPADYANRFSTRFDGTDDRLTGNIPYNPSGAWSAFVWFKVDSDASTGTKTIMTTYQLGANALTNVQLNLYGLVSGSNFAFYPYIYDGSTSGSSFFPGLTNLALGVWHHVGITVSGSGGTAQAYVNGSAHGSSGTAPTYNTSAGVDTIQFGARGHSGGGIYFHDGSLDEAVFYERALSASEVSALYNGGSPTNPMNTTGVTADAVAYYRLGDRWNRGTVPDVIGSADLTMSSAPVPEKDVPSVLWTPAEMTTLRWYDASDASTITQSGGDISNWGDKSGNGNDLYQSTAGYQPVVDSASLGGLDTVSFVPSGGATVSYMLMPSANIRSFACVIRYGNITRQWVPFVVGDTSGVAAWHGDGGASADYVHHGFATANVRNGTHTRDGSIISLQATGKDTDWTVMTTTTQTTTEARNQVGRYGTVSGRTWYQNSIAELVIFDTAPSVSDRQKLEGYLAWKWDGGTAGTLVGLLPATHPYKSGAPTV